MTVHIYTDSRYVRDGMTKWVSGWKRNGWRTAAKAPVKNVDLWLRLVAAIEGHDVRWFWLKGHAGIRRTSLPTSWRALASTRRVRVRNRSQSDQSVGRRTWRGRSALQGYGQRGTGALQLVFDRLDT